MRPLTRAQLAQNRRFLAALAQTGNARLAARELGLNRSMLTKRRKKHASFAQQWDAAIAAAHARFHLSGGPRLPDVDSRSYPRRGTRPAGGSARPNPSDDVEFTSTSCRSRTKGGEPTIVRTRGGKLQLRLARPGQVTRAGEQAFLRALSATANVRLSAAAAGLSHSTAYKRKHDSEAFRREFRTALEIGYDRLRCATIAGAVQALDPYDDWMHGKDLEAIPPTSFSEALQLLAMHRNTVALGWSEPHRRKRRNETHEQYGQRLALMWRAEQRNFAHERAEARGRAWEESGSWRLESDWPEVAELPPLETVTTWSGKRERNTEAAEAKKGKGLFGGWSIEDLEKRRRSG